MIVKHPTIAGLCNDVPDEDVPAWEASGWLPLLDESQRVRLTEIEAEAQHACPTCHAAVGEACKKPSGEPANHTHKARLAA